jgi:hypothetical protein
VQTFGEQAEAGQLALAGIAQRGGDVLR